MGRKHAHENPQPITQYPIPQANSQQPTAPSRFTATFQTHHPHATLPRMSRTSRPPSLPSATPLRPATYAGLAAAFVSIAAAVAIRLSPNLETPVASAHLLLTGTFYLMGGALAARLGADGWRAGLFAGLLDALIGHAIAFLIAAPPDASRILLPSGVEPTPQLLGSMQLWGALLGAAMAIGIAIACGAAGGWYAKRTRR